MSQNAPKGAPEQDARSSRTEERLSSRAQRKIAEKESAKKRMLWTVIGAIAALAIVGLIVFAVTRKPEVPAVAVAPAIDADLLVSGRGMGDPDAPVKVVEFGDYQCPGCKFFDETVKPQLIEDFVKPGKIHFEFRDYAFIGPESKTAAIGAFCAAEQDKFWQFHNTLYINQSKTENGGGLTPEYVRAIGEQTGLDMTAYDACIASDAPANAVDDMIAEAQAAGVNSTPSVLIDGVKIDWQGYDDLKPAIEEALKKAGA